MELNKTGRSVLALDTSVHILFGYYMSLENSEVYYKSTGVTIRYHEGNEMGITIWKSPISSHEVREAVLLVYHAIERFGLTRWLSDVRNLKAFQNQDKQWAVENVLPSLLSSNLRKFAILLPSNQKGSPETNHILHQVPDVEHSVEISTFYDLEEALSWLLEESLQTQT